MVSTLLSQPKESFAAQLKETTEPPEVKIAVGDTISILIWESAAGGLFSEAPPTPSSFGSRTGVEPLAPESRPPESETPGETRAPGLSGRPRDEAEGRPRSWQPSGSQPRKSSRSRAPGRPAGVRPPEYPISRSVPMGRSASPMPAAFLPPGVHRQSFRTRSRRGSPGRRCNRKRWSSSRKAPPMRSLSRVRSSPAPGFRSRREGTGCFK